MCSAYTVKFKFTNAKQEIVFVTLRIQSGCHRWPKLLRAVNMNITLVTIVVCDITLDRFNPDKFFLIPFRN